MEIRVLPYHIAARIAAGEVVERPASAVKELVENALDAGASRIGIDVRGTGLGRIAVWDDGKGMTPEDLALAPCRHATSKLVDDDLLKVATLGYRGEALPSIGSVARLRLTSRPAGQDVAFSVSCEAGSVSQPRPCSGSTGTRVEVADLFAAHPARLKFQKSQRTEAAAIRDVIASLALTRHDVEFRFCVNDMDGLYPSRATLAERAADVLGQSFARDAVEVSMRTEEVAVTGLACLPSAARSDASGLRFCVNGRTVTDKTLRAAARSAYASLIGRGRHPMAFLSISLPSEAVDVNVHPRKAEVRFRSPGLVADAVTRAVGGALDRAGLRSPALLPDLARSLAHAGDVAADDRRRLPLGRFIGQANGSWIVSETTDGIVIVDQHAAHERVIMERLRNSRPFSGLETVSYPAPRRLETAPSEAAAVHDCIEELRGMGFLVAAGDSHVELARVPAVLADCDPDVLCRLVVRCASEGVAGGLLGEALWEKLATAACKAAIKAGQALTAERADTLLREIEATPNGAACNHGRPTVAFLSGNDIARLFARG